MAEHSLSYDRERGCVHVVFTGTVDLLAIQQVAPKVARLCEETGCRRILNDMSRARVDVSATDAYASPEIMDKAHVSRSFRRALVVPADFAEARFLETASRNRGHNLKVFFSAEEARAWLEEEG